LQIGSYAFDLRAIAAPGGLFFVAPLLGARQATAPSNFLHVVLILTDRDAPFAAGGARLVLGKFMSPAGFVGDAPAVAGNFPLFFG